MFLYHRVPPHMEGMTLYPLNTLKTLHPDLYAQYVQKYAGREHLMQERIPLLGNCLWNDVLFLTAVHPEQFRAAWESLFPPFKHYRFYALQVTELDPANLAVLTEMEVDRGGTFRRFEKRSIAEYATVPEETFNYWKERKAQGLRPLIFMHIPHILYRGAISIASASVINL